jgi:hypothetical protein
MMLNASKHRKSYTNMYKRFVVRYYFGLEKPSKRKTAVIFKLAPATVRDWIKIKDELNSRKCPLSRRYLTNHSEKSKKGLFPDVEEEVYKWFVDLRSNDIVVTSLGLKNKMANIMRISHPEEEIVWKSSYGWLRNFMKRFDLSFRRITKSGREFPKNCFQVIKDFLEDVKSRIEKNGENF